MRGADVGDDADGGPRDRGERRDLAAVVHADLDHDARRSRARRSSVSGTPYSLFRLPCGLEAGRRPPRIAAHISLVVVLPLLPVIATSGPRNRARWPAASAPSAVVVSATSITGSSRRSSAGSARPRRTTRPPAPADAAFARKPWASWLRARDRDEELARSERAGVDRDAGELASPGCPVAARRRIHAAASPARSCALIGRLASRARGAASSRSSKGRRSRPTIW